MSGAYIFGCMGLALSADEKAFFRDADPWGFIVFAKNLESPEQICRLTLEMREAIGRDAPILIDQEGGRVARLKAPHWHEWLPALDQMDKTKAGCGARAMWLRYRVIADELRALGIDTNCAPIADIPAPDVHPIIQNRCYGRDVGQVTEVSRAVAYGLLAGGVLPVLKHIPGHGRPVADSHESLPHTDVSRNVLEQTDFAAFQNLADLSLGMTAHVVFDDIDPTQCATLSPTVIKLIRDEIGFDGLLMSDDISMKALEGCFKDRTKAALAAGCDLILHCHGHMHEMIDVASAAGAMNAQARARAERALACRVEPEKIDQKALLAELDDLLIVSSDEQHHSN